MPTITPSTTASSSRDDSVLALLRRLTPPRQLTSVEATRVAELQANRFRSLFGIEGPMMPSDIVVDLPRIQVKHDPDLPVSGLTHWTGDRWTVTLNTSEPRLRRRFSLMHEFKHIIDHPARLYLYGRPDQPGARKQTEHVADHFAACLLMPRRWVKRLWGQGIQSMAGLAARFKVSVPAMRYRVDQLGLDLPRQRCQYHAMTREEPAQPSGRAYR